MGTIWTPFRGCASLAPAVQCTRSLRRSGTGGGKTCRGKMMPDAWRIPASNEIQYITISYKYMCHVFYIHRVRGEVTMPCCYNTGFYFSHASYQQHGAVRMQQHLRTLLLTARWLSQIRLLWTLDFCHRRFQGIDPYDTLQPLQPAAPFVQIIQSPHMLFASLVATPWHCALCVSV